MAPNDEAELLRRFGLVGGLCFAVTLSTFTALHGLGVHYILASVIGIAAASMSANAQQSARAAFDELKQGGFVIIIRT